MGHELRSVVAANAPGNATDRKQVLEYLDDITCLQRPTHFKGQARLQLQIIKNQKGAIERLSLAVEERDRLLEARGKEVEELLRHAEEAREAREAAAAEVKDDERTEANDDAVDAAVRRTLAQADAQHRIEMRALEERLTAERKDKVAEQAKDGAMAAAAAEVQDEPAVQSGVRSMDDGGGNPANESNAQRCTSCSNLASWRA